MDKINEAGCHKVRQMADGRDGKIMLMVVENDGKSTDTQGNLTDPVDLHQPLCQAQTQGDRAAPGTAALQGSLL